MKKLGIILGLVLLIAGGVFLYSRGHVVGPERVFLSRFAFSGDAVLLKGGFNTDGLYFSGYDTRVEGDSLYIKIRGNTTNTFGGTDLFDLRVKSNLKTIKRVYLSNENNTQKALIWAQ